MPLYNRADRACHTLSRYLVSYNRSQSNHRFTYKPSSRLPRRISTLHKMAPQLDSYFKQYVGRFTSSFHPNNIYPGSTACRGPSSNVWLPAHSSRLETNSISGLRQAVAIPSISAEDARRPDVVKVSWESCAYKNVAHGWIDGRIPGGRAEEAWC